MKKRVKRMQGTDCLVEYPRTFIFTYPWYLPAGRQGSTHCFKLFLDMITVYALKSEITDNIYVGMTGNLERRLQEHNTGNTQSTKSGRPWRIIYKEVGFIDHSSARFREKYLKSGRGKEFLKRLSLVAQR